VSKYERELLKRLPPGYRIAPRTTREGAGDSKHNAVYDPDGNVLRLPDGMPILVAGSTRSGRTFLNDLARIRRAGVPTR
jgi:hypothetical protein